MLSGAGAAAKTRFGDHRSPTTGGSILSNRKLWSGLGLVALLGGMALNWNWLVAAGLAPVLLAILPCGAMCALNLCSKGGGEGACKRDSLAPIPVPVPAPGRQS